MMKSLLVSLLFLTGCVWRSGPVEDLHTFSAKYIPGDCAVPTAKKVEQAPQLAGVELYVQGLYKDGYSVVFIKDGQPRSVADVDKVEFDAGSSRAACSEATLKLFPADPEVEE